MSKEERIINYYVLCNKLKDIVRSGWKVYKNNGVWKLLCYVFLFSTIIYCTIDMIIKTIKPEVLDVSNIKILTLIKQKKSRFC